MFFIEILKAIFLGIVEGITEWLPISSTGHMILVDEFIKLNVSKEFLDMFMVVIQLGAILAVIVLYFQKLNPFSRKKTVVERKQTWSLWLKVLIACLPAGIIGLIFDDKINELFFNPWTIAITLIVYGVLFIIVEIFNRKRKPKIRELSQLPYTMAFLIGVFQLLALIPGTSRSGVTIITALLLGASRFVAAEFTFFLAIPVMLGASALKLVKFGFSYTGLEIAVLIAGVLTAFLVSVLAIKFLMKYIKKHDFKIFGVYRILLGIAVIIYFSIVGTSV
ncbi:MAG: undecaprenyl-diphosphate phosphatase [Acutalibacteraceae bacterium]|nr:undecaprenyl-diphosphate phosphatase [Acutalibacteraceae bacterium]